MERQPLTVTALTKYLKYCLDNDTNLQNIYLKGEISNFKHHSRGHFYFTLKDEQSQINAVMFSANAEKIKVRLEDGMKVNVVGHVSLYVVGGSYQIYVTDIILDGIGELYKRYEQLKEKLAKEGLFDPSHKRPIPRIPTKIGVITSNTGAAIRDILTTIERRFPLVTVVVFPTLVQGEQAKIDIVKSIEKANSYKDIDVIILGRGGGSIEDLWCFNEEMVAYAIYRSRIPIISAVGHETDFTIADFVADLRAATPTAASELAVPNKYDLFAFLNQTKARLYHKMSSLIKMNHQQLYTIRNSYLFREPSRLFEQHYLKLDKLYLNLEKNSPKTDIENKKGQVVQLKNRLDHLFEKKYISTHNQFMLIMNKLELVNPLSILQKGYTIIQKDERAIQTVNDVEMNDRIKVIFKDGSINCVVNAKEVKV